jgi:peptidyl-tRNA hydrolase, PTH2 family
VKCPTEEELMALRNEAAARGITFYLVVDAGRTQIASGSRTVLAIGPAPVAVLDEFTKHLKLY